MTRVYQNQELRVGEVITLDAEASHHLSRVLRLAQNDKVTVFNGRGGEYSGAITQMSKKQVGVSLESYNDPKVEPELKICLVQGLARGEKMDFIIQKACELGVSSVQPVVTQFCNVKLSKERAEKRLQHWQAVAISACEQSGRTRIPQIFDLVDIKQWMVEAAGQANYILCPHSDSINLKTEQLNEKSVNILIGPEGGFSPEELNKALGLGVKPLKLGPRILRTETAPLTAITAFQLYFGDV